MKGRPRKGMTPLQRFMDKVVKHPTGCWLWPAHLTTSGGYSLFYSGPERKHVLGHRWAYEQFVGPIPEGLHLDHLCRVRECVNPEHLEPVTVRENNLRAKTNPAAINAAKTHCPKNHPYSDENTYVTRGRRHCRTCHRERQRKAVAA